MIDVPVGIADGIEFAKARELLLERGAVLANFYRQRWPLLEHCQRLRLAESIDPGGPDQNDVITRDRYY
jgi:hypothetical protein